MNGSDDMGETFAALVALYIGFTLLVHPEVEIRRTMKRLRLVNQIGEGDGSIWLVIGVICLLASAVMFFLSGNRILPWWLLFMSVVFFVATKVTRETEPFAMRAWLILVWLFLLRAAGLVFFCFGAGTLYHNIVKH